MLLTEDHVKFIERLRKAARAHDVVSELLYALYDVIPVDLSGDVELQCGDPTQLEYLNAAIMAVEFVMFDKKGGVLDA